MTKGKAKKFVEKMDKLRPHKKTEIEYVEVVDPVLSNEEDLDTLIQLPFVQLLGLPLEKFLQHVSVLAIGKEDEGQFKIEPLVVQLAGVVDDNVVFRIKGKLQTYKVTRKKLPKVVEAKKVKRGKKKNS